MFPHMPKEIRKRYRFVEYANDLPMRDSNSSDHSGIREYNLYTTASCHFQNSMQNLSECFCPCSCYKYINKSFISLLSYIYCICGSNRLKQLHEQKHFKCCTHEYVMCEIGTISMDNDTTILWSYGQFEPRTLHIN